MKNVLTVIIIFVFRILNLLSYLNLRQKFYKEPDFPEPFFYTSGFSYNCVCACCRRSYRLSHGTGNMEKHSEYKDAVIRELPSTLMIELTNICQLSCITCPREYTVAQKNAATGNMGLDKFKILVDRYIGHCKNISLTGGGETFLYPQLVEAVDYVLENNRHVEIFISTNAGVRDTKRIMESLAGKIMLLQISIDGTGSVYEKIRRKGVYDQFRDNVEAIVSITKDTRTSLMFNMVLIKENINEILPILNLARTFGIPRVNAHPINLVIHDWDISYYDFYLSEAVRDAVAGAREFAALEGIDFTYYDLRNPQGFENCPFLWSNFYITWDGFLVPCCAKPLSRLLNFGNVFEKDLMDCINHPMFVEFRKMSRLNKAPSFCSKCHLL